MAVDAAAPRDFPSDKLKKSRRGRSRRRNRSRVLVTVAVVGSAGPLRFLMDEGESVAAVIRTALRCYAREGRLPAFGACLDDFLLYHANGEFHALSPEERISFDGRRSFVLCKKLGVAEEKSEEKSQPPFTRRTRRSRSFKSLLNKLLSFKISTQVPVN